MDLAGRSNLPRIHIPKGSANEETIFVSRALQWLLRKARAEASPVEGVRALLTKGSLVQMPLRLHLSLAKVQAFAKPNMMRRSYRCPLTFLEEGESPVDSALEEKHRRS